MFKYAHDGVEVSETLVGEKKHGWQHEDMKQEQLKKLEDEGKRQGKPSILVIRVFALFPVGHRKVGLEGTCGGHPIQPPA